MSTSSVPPGGSAADRRDNAEVNDRLSGPGALFEIRDEEVRGQVMPVFRNRFTSLGQVLEASARFAARTYVVDGDVRLSYAEHLDRARSLAQVMVADHKVKPGDRVAIFAANRWDWLLSFWAAIAAGAVPCGFNGWWTADEFGHAMDLVEPVLVVADRARLDRLGRAAPAGPVLDLDEDLAVRLHSGGEPGAVHLAGEDEPALLLFTSGTTGRPKAATIPHRAVIGFVQLNHFSEMSGRVAYGMAVPEAAADIGPADDIHLVTSPLFHTSMLYGVAVTSMYKGAACVLLPGRFDPERVLAAIQAEKVTGWSALGSAASRLAACPAVGRYDTSSMRYLGVGGAPVSPDVQQRLRHAFPGTSTTLGMGYTSTEAGAVVARIGGPEFVAHPTSTGRIMVTTQVELRDREGRPVPPGEDGEVHVRSPYLMLGYWNNPEASAAALKEGGWLAMGDVARFEDGRLYINARARDLIFVNAENVSPSEVEYVLEAHPAVMEAAVLAVDDEVTGDAVCAVVVLMPNGADGAGSADATGLDGAGPGAGDLTDWCRASLAPYKVPTRWVFSEQPLPRTATGKLLKDALRAEAADRA